LLRGIVGLAFVVVWYGQRSGLRVMRVFTRPALVARGLLGSLGLICYYWTIPRLGTGVATLVSSTYVVFGAVFATCFLLREKLSLSQLIWLFVSLVGVGLLMNVRAGIDQSFAVGLLGAVSAGMVIVIIRYLHKTDEATPTIFASQCIYAMLAVAPWAFPELVKPSTVQLGWAILASFMATFGQLAMTHSFRYLNVSTGGALHLSIPVWVSIGGGFLFDERLAWLQVFGGILVILGCLMAIRR
jgi:drug/metabolite transporter (DMT)-like permease